MQELFDKELPKWPALIVRGKSVTKDQAKEIIIRTDSFEFCSNDREFEGDIHELIYGVRSNWINLTDKLQKELNISKDAAWDLTKEKKVAYGVLDLDYLTNSRIVSSWIGGPKGWCSWDGYIGTNNYNIGKWPSVQAVYNEWVKIAAAFPFLDLKCQLLNAECGEENLAPVVEYVVKDGKVELVEPTELLDGTNNDMFTNIANIFNNPFRERGCSKEQLKDALDFVLNSRAELSKQ